MTEAKITTEEAIKYLKHFESKSSNLEFYKSKNLFGSASNNWA